MSRKLLALLLTLLVVALAHAASDHPECAPLHTLYTAATTTCTSGGTIIPQADTDPRWKPCICANGFYPVALATEQCVVGQDGTTRLTAASLDTLCKGYSGYVAAASQKPPTTLAAAQTSASALAAALPTATGTASSGKTSAGIAGAAPAALTLLASVLVAVALL